MEKTLRRGYYRSLVVGLLAGVALGQPTPSASSLQDPKSVIAITARPTTDKNIRYHQNLTDRKIALVVLGNSQWPMVKLVSAAIVVAVDAAKPGSYAEVAVPFKE